MTDEFREILGEQLSVIDAVLAARETPIPLRIFEAAVFFVRHCFVSIEGDTKDDFLEKPWFAEIFEASRDWYVSRYGVELLSRESDDALHGLVSLYGSLFRVDVPLVRHGRSKDGEGGWICFPTEVQADENPLKWIHSPPSLDTLGAEERERIKTEVIRVASEIRECHRDLVAATFDSEEYEKLARSVPTHLSTGAAHALRETHLRGLAVWEFHLAAEKSLKAFLFQHGQTAQRTHDLGRLADDAETLGLQGLDRTALFRLPSADEAIDFRYGTGDPVSSAQIQVYYRASLAACVSCTRQLRRNLAMRNTTFHFRRLHWGTKNLGGREGGPGDRG